MADRTYVSNSPTTVTTREVLPLAVSFANRLGDGESVTASSTPGSDVKLQDKATGTDVSTAITTIQASSPLVTVTINFAHAALEESKTYVLRVLGTIGSRKEEAAWDLITHFL
jgi:hypothetical protein